MNMQLFNNYNKSLQNIPFNKQFFLRVAKTIPIQLEQQRTYSDNSDSQEDNSRVRWGPSIWFLFHTLTHKIKYEDFPRLKMELLDIIKGICANLPCPTCASHASQYMKNINYNSINNKEELKIFMFKFHNDVNIRRSIEPFSFTELDSKYSKANTLNIIKNFISVFKYKSKSFNMIANDMQRTRQLELFIGWINTNINSFEI